MNQTNKQKEKNLDKFIVNDLIKSNTKIIFILESPHINEIKEHHPLAGKTGKLISKKLFSNDNSFGSLLIENRSIFKDYGIMNISQIPLQASAYPNDYTNNSQIYNILRMFELIRKNPKLRVRNRKFPKDKINALITELKYNFTQRIKEIDNYKNNKYTTRFI